MTWHRQGEMAELKAALGGVRFLRGSSQPAAARLPPSCQAQALLLPPGRAGGEPNPDTPWVGEDEATEVQAGTEQMLDRTQVNFFLACVTEGSWGAARGSLCVKRSG